MWVLYRRRTSLTLRCKTPWVRFNCLKLTPVPGTPNRQNSAPPRTPTAPLPPPPTPGAPCLRPGGRWGDRTGRNRIMRIEPDRHPGRVGPARTPGSILITLPRPVLRAGGPGSRARGERGRAFTISLLPQSNKFKTIRCFGMCCQPSGKVGDRFGSILGPFWADSGHPGAVPGRSGSILATGTRWAATKSWTDVLGKSTRKAPNVS